MSRIVAVAPVLPPHAYPQAEITAEIGGLVTTDPRRLALLRRVQASSGIDTRHLVLPLEKYAGLSSFGETNDLFLREGLELGARAVEEALDAVGLRPRDVDHLFFTTVTGVSAPSLDALLVGRLGLRPDVRRVPSFGLGCAGGAAGLARVHDHLVGHPDEVAVLLSVELCSLTLQQDDDSTANLVASGLFGDGAAAAVLVGDARAAALGLDGPAVVGAHSVLYPGTEGDLGWHVGGSGFRIVLSGEMAETVAAHADDDVAALLAPLGVTAADVARWVVHPGGPRILDAVRDSVGLDEAEVATSRATLAAVGNLSSAAVLHVLARTLAGPPPPAGALGALVAYGPGVSAELLALRWPGGDEDRSGPHDARNDGPHDGPHDDSHDGRTVAA
ncbi:type III polyketide synthase [Cellulomonas marina]|uniref:Alkylresorcinol/alkylpyrone synthase n=1 Tax=Cellulomonas marina TaxID=988821 RepID=A0A1I0V4K3_9CELL|nr:3-oxoacyl-[acyl-carrier-protein] synthase III C-terminal domain-containing protein [Cellulomonas marina]GIG28316.1 polyketide synthase-like Pks10 [Cellulomonas marina]SFA71020.1 alkylresorcinol/alkylpyrone synthase [Cellulomonas marina]